MTVDAPRLQVALDHELAGDAGVIAAGHPQAGVAQHAVPADHHVLQRHEQGVAVVEAAGHVGRRHGDDERLPAAKVGVRLGLEQLVLDPEVVPAGLGLGRVVRRVALGGGGSGWGGSGHLGGTRSRQIAPSSARTSGADRGTTLRSLPARL